MRFDGTGQAAANLVHRASLCVDLSERVSSLWVGAVVELSLCRFPVHLVVVSGRAEV